MMKSGWRAWPLGVSLKHDSDVRAARILVIEDNPSDVFLLKRALNRQDLRFELVHLSNGGEGLAFIRKQGVYADAAIPDLILVDLNLSKYTGEDILREIRSAPHLGGVPVCVWSSSKSRGGQSLAQGPRRFAVHHQAFRSGSVHGNRQSHQGCARRGQSQLTALEFSWRASEARRGRHRTGATRAQSVVSVPVITPVRFGEKVKGGCGKKDRKSWLKGGSAFSADA